jgi:hypothetical protein
MNIAQILMVCLREILLHFKNDEMEGSDNISKNSIDI